MTTLSINQTVTSPRNWLKFSATSWFIVTAIGQWLFVAYIMGYFGRRFVGAGLEGFEGTGIHGFIPGDGIGNIALASHVLLAGLIIAAGQIQLIPALRHKVPRLQRYSGWFYLLAAVAVSLAGIYILWSRERIIGSLMQDIGVTGGGVLVIIFMPIALYHAINRNIAAHRRWVLRLFMVVSAVWFFRLMLFGWLMATGGIGIDQESFSGPFLEIVGFAQYLLPLAMLELYFLAQKPAYQAWRGAVAGLILLMTTAMAIGIVAISSFVWLPSIAS